MAKEQRIPVVGADGLIGYLAQRPARNGSANLRLTDGRELSVPVSDLRERNDGTFYLPHGGPDTPQPTPAGWDAGQQTVVPVIAEELVVDKRSHPRGRVRVRKKIDERKETVDLPLAKERVDIRRVVINQDVSDIPPIRREGETTIIPVVEEVIVIQKKLRLKEEIHIVRRREEERHVEEVTLKDERVEIERIDEQGHSEVVEPEVEHDVPFLGGSGTRSFIRKNKVVT